ncbi:MAG: DNA polymerase III subunit gamma/tau [Roseburia sp.]|nr:DNA polymerase III subunit gamma/tau [Anaeroplasma bactoclasticum]MCM1195724.1 DNA polymerase III subunit gamma/tau [Roseburia sp.]MCM1556074.1 DNA polymerase III subunit gamma/tau [Anaeroplasma bactoclasticum]
MAYVALYRAYRPQKFCDVVGQQHIIKTLQNAIKLNKVAHAYLFCGPRGTGKTTLAKIMAKALNCVHGPSIEPCDECEICQGIQKGTVADVVEIDAASNNGADDIRALRDSVKYMPAIGKYKVYIIDEVHMLSNAAFNALLKTLEEPPKHVIFILATTEPYKLPSTILSRCQRFDFQSLAIEDILRRLKIVAKAENIRMTEEAFNQIASSAEGGMRDALSLFDQTISFSIHDEITLEDVLAVSGNVSYKELLKILEACLEGNGTAALKLVDHILKEGKEVPRVINDMIIFLRDVLLFKSNAILDDRLEFHNQEFIDFTKKISKTVIYDWLNHLNETNNTMRFSNQKRAYLELAILKMSDIKLNEEANLLERIEQLEHTIHMLSMTKAEAPKPQPIEVTIPTREEIEQIQAETISVLPVEKPKVEVLKPQPIANENEVQIEEIEEILNSASKSRKQRLQAIWKQIGAEYSSVFIAQILVAGEIVAVNENKLIVVLNDLGFCNRLMRYENYQKIMEIFDVFNAGLSDYICLPKVIWNRIKADYASKYSQENPIVHLEKIKIGVLKRKEPDQIEVKDEQYEALCELIEKEKIEILED